jgi:beta-glucosidase/6-phospho-beta-glucosidase/beta-galactosidase
MSQLIFSFRHKFQVMTRMGFDGRRRGCAWGLAMPNPDGRHTEYQLRHYVAVDIFSPHAEHVPAFIDAYACGAMPCRIQTIPCGLSTAALCRS